jgi:hypothetical protein
LNSPRNSLDSGIAPAEKRQKFQNFVFLIGSIRNKNRQIIPIYILFLFFYTVDVIQESSVKWKRDLKDPKQPSKESITLSAQLECILDAFLSPPKRFKLMEILHSI